jgi:hypothetical protein
MNSILSAFRTQSSSSKPVINNPHFKSQLRMVRAENIDFYSALNDMVDNVVGLANVNNENYYFNMNFMFDENEKQVYRIYISDNVSHGFKDIVKNGEENPFNMGHIRSGHIVDKEMSEFGIGMKKSLIFLCNKFDLYTKCINEDGTTTCYHLGMNFLEMKDVIDPSKSYEWTMFEVITEEQFIEKKPDGVGSLFVLEGIRQTALGEPSLNNTLEQNDFLRKIREKLGFTFRYNIHTNIDIEIYDVKVEPSKDIIKDNISDENKVTMKMRVNRSTKNVYMFKDGKCRIYKKDTKKYNQVNKNKEIPDEDDKDVEDSWFFREFYSAMNIASQSGILLIH